MRSHALHRLIRFSVILSLVVIPILISGCSSSSQLRLVYYHSLSGPASGLVLQASPDAQWVYSGGGLESVFYQAPVSIAGRVPLWLTGPYTVQIDARAVTGSSTHYGLVFGAVVTTGNWVQDSYYIFLVDPSTQTYTVHRWTPAQQLVWISGGHSNAINPGTLVNRLRIERSGSLAYIFVNGLYVTSVPYSDPGDIAVGLWAQTTGSTPASARFNNLYVYAQFARSAAQFQSATGSDLDDPLPVIPMTGPDGI